MDITIRVKPGSRKGPLVEPLVDDPSASVVVFVRERAVDGAANEGVVAALAEYYGVPRRRCRSCAATPRASSACASRRR